MIVAHTHQWVPWDEHRLTVCDEEGCTAGFSWDQPPALGLIDWTDVITTETSVTDVSPLTYAEEMRRFFTRRRLLVWRTQARLRAFRRWLRCAVRLGHDWRYFVDGFIGRSCDRCEVTQYDLPGVRG